jgi:hypothetical protein
MREKIIKILSTEAPGAPFFLKRGLSEEEKILLFSLSKC